MNDNVGRNEMTVTENPSRGLLPRGGYDIYCPLMGGDPAVANYLAGSCQSRQAARACTEKTCPRRRAVAPVRQHRLQAPSKHADTPALKKAPPRVKPRQAKKPTAVTQPPVAPAFDPAAAAVRGGIAVALVIPDSQAHLYRVLVAAARRHRRSLTAEILARLTKRLKP